MNIDVSKAIRELLYEHPAVIVPGLGGFTSTAVPATVDYVQGQVAPPSKKLDFNPNLVINDGMLMQHLQKGHVVTFQDAGNAIEAFVNGVKQTLERREIVEIQSVGRLYKDYEGKLRFMPDGTNFSTDAFGLPTVSFSPVSRERMPVAPVEATTAAAVAAPQASVEPTDAEAPPPKTLVQRVLPWLVLLAAVLIAFLIYQLFGGKNGTVADAQTGKERVNVKPQDELAGGTQDVTPAPVPTPKISEDLPPSSQSSPETQKPATSVPDGADTEEDELEPTKPKAFLVVHSFGVKANATKFAKKLSEDGYSPQTKRVDNLYRVGVVFPYSNQSEIEKMRRELAKKYDAGPKTEKELAEQGK